MPIACPLPSASLLPSDGNAWLTCGPPAGQGPGNVPSRLVAALASIAASKVEATTVYNLQGDKLGSIDDVFIDKRSGQVRFAALEFAGFLGIGKDR